MPLRESVASRLRPLKQVVEELSARREAGFNQFTRDEVAVSRLLNTLDDLLNSDTREPGGLLLFLTQVVQFNLPYATLTHQPLQKVHERNLPNALDAARYWIVCAINLPGALKETLQRTLDATDVLTAYYYPHAILFDADFKLDFLSTLALLHNSALGPTEFNLDVTALQLFYQRAEPVTFSKVSKGRRTHHHAKKSGGEEHSHNGHHRSHHSREEEPESSHTTSSETQTVLEGKHLVIRDLVEEDEEYPVMMLPANRAASPARLRPLAESWCQTDQPSPSITFDAFCRMEQEQKEREKEVRASHAKVKELEARWKEKNDEAEERLEAILAVLVATRSIYNDVVVANGEAEMELRELKPSDIHPLIPKILSVVYQKADVVRQGSFSVPSRLNSGVQGVSGSATTPPHPAQQHPTSNTPAKDDTNTVSSDSQPPDSPSSRTTTDDSRHREEAGSFDLHALLEAAKTSGQAALSRVSSQTVVGGDTPPAVPVGNLPLHLTVPVEKERDTQLRLQNNQCASCDAKFPGNEKNVVLKMVSRTATALTMQKPRRCHYCCNLFCHKCHTNKQTLLPFRVFQRWDFTVQHVCNNCYDFLTANLERPLYSLKSLPREISQRPNVVAAVKLRKKMIALNRVVVECRDLPSSLAPFTASHYFTREEYFSLADFTRLRGGDNKLAELNPLQMVLGSHEDLLVMLAAMFKKMKNHVLECKGCHARSIARCAICNDAKPVMSFEEDGWTCERCGSIYHKTCFDAMGCKKCNAH